MDRETDGQIDMKVRKKPYFRNKNFSFLKEKIPFFTEIISVTISL